jgi:hypothetical protein
LSKKITSELIEQVIGEIEKPLITIQELASESQLNEKQILWFISKLHIKPYLIMEDSRHRNALDEDMVKMIFGEVKKKKWVNRKNKLDVRSLI